MKRLDFLSSSPSIYLMKEKKGKNKLGGFFSIIFLLIMLILLIYYLYVFFYGLEYSLTYYRDNWTTSFTKEEKEYIKKPKTFIVYLDENYNNAKITGLLSNGNETKSMNYCNDKFEIDPNGHYLCFNLSFYHLAEKGKEYTMFYLLCRENCTDSEGRSSEIGFNIYTPNLKIDHSRQNPLLSKHAYGDHIYIATNNNQYVNYLLVFTPILYRTSAVLNTKSYEYVDTYYNDVHSRTIYSPGQSFAGFNLVMNTNCDIYIREYKTLLDTLSKIGGLFSQIKLFFYFLVMFYSDFENNSEITKNVFLKRDKYEYKMKNNISLQKGLNIEIPNEIKISSDGKEKEKDDNFDSIEYDDGKIKRKKFNINKGEQYFFSFCNICKSHKSMKILNLCNDFVENYLSAENIIFNMILFESYYKENPINFKENSYLSKIQNEIEPDFYDENEKTKLVNKLNEK